MKGQYLNNPPEAGKAYPVAFYERQLPEQPSRCRQFLFRCIVCKQLPEQPSSIRQSLSWCHLMKGNHLDNPPEAGNSCPVAFSEKQLLEQLSRSGQSLFRCIYERQPPGQPSRSRQSLSRCIDEGQLPEQPSRSRQSLSRCILSKATT